MPGGAAVRRPVGAFAFAHSRYATGRHPSGIDRGYADPVVVDECVSENNAFDLLPCQFVRGDPVDLFLLQGRKKALHPRVVKAMSRPAEALGKSCPFERISECFAGILTSSVAVKDCAAELFSILHFKLLYGSDAKLLLHIAVHCNGKDLTVVAIENRRQIQLAVITLDLGNVGKQLLKRLFRLKIPFDQVFAVLNLCCSFGRTARGFFSYEEAPSRT